MPAFPVYNLETGEAHEAFKRRPLTSHEGLHPFFEKVEDDNERKDREDAKQFGECSVVSTLHMFKRALQIFTMGLFDKAPLDRNACILAGGAVSACLQPWPPHIVKIYKEELKLRSLFERDLGLPPEIGHRIESYAQIVHDKKLQLDLALFQFFGISGVSPYAHSDLDLFFICPSGSTDVSNALDLFPKVHSQIVKNRAEKGLEMTKRFITDRGPSPLYRHWVCDEVSDKDFDWFYDTSLQMKMEEERIKAGTWKDGDGISYEELGKYKEEQLKNHNPDEDNVDKEGWSKTMEELVGYRFKLLWTVRTPNSVTITG
jgi:hypothetical protein